VCYIHFHYVHSLLLGVCWSFHEHVCIFWSFLAQRPRQPPSPPNGSAGPEYSANILCTLTIDTFAYGLRICWYPMCSVPLYSRFIPSDLVSRNLFNQKLISSAGESFPDNLHHRTSHMVALLLLLVEAGFWSWSLSLSGPFFGEIGRCVNSASKRLCFDLTWYINCNHNIKNTQWLACASLREGLCQEWLSVFPWFFR